MLQLQQDLDHTRNTGSQLQMSHIAFHRTDPAHGLRHWPLSYHLGQLAEGGLEPINFNRITKRSPSSMRFDIAYCAGIDRGLAVGRDQ